MRHPIISHLMAFVAGAGLRFIFTVFMLLSNDSLWEDAFSILYRTALYDTTQVDTVACAGVKHRYPFLNKHNVEVPGCQKLIISWANRETAVALLDSTRKP